MKTNKEQCEEYLEVLRVANEQWFYGYHYSVEDHTKLVEALNFFDSVKKQQRKKLIQEGLI